MEIKVSIIIPVYQVSAYIERCISSVLSQTYSDIECIIIDDATLDDSIIKCERIINDYKGPIQFKILHHSENRGLSAARNTGTYAAVGEYLYYLDSDDCITPDCIENMMGIVQDYPDVDMVVGDVAVFSNDVTIKTCFTEGLPSHVLSNEMVFSLFNQQLIPLFAWNKILKRSFINAHKLFFKEGIIFEDVVWTFHVIKYLSNMYIFNGITYNYYIREGSILTGSDDNTFGKNFSMLYDEILSHLTPGRENSELNRFVDGFCRRYVQFHKDFPLFDELMKTFLKDTLDYGCRLAHQKLVMSRILGQLPFGLSILFLLQSIKQKAIGIAKRGANHAVKARVVPS